MRAAAAWTTELAVVLLAVCSDNTRKMAPPLVSTIARAAPAFKFSLFVLTIKASSDHSSCQISGLSTFRALNFGQASRFACRAPEKCVQNMLSKEAARTALSKRLLPRINVQQSFDRAVRAASMLSIF
jgi:hypothetical protein